MRFAELLSGTPVIRRAGPDPEVRGIEYDSRRIGPGSLFLAMQGGTTDGNRYVGNAIAQGASSVLTDSAAAFDAAARQFPQIAIAEVGAGLGRMAMSSISARFFLHPERRLAISGITGTNGKTTTAFLLDAMLRAGGRVTVLLGTIENRIAGAVRPTAHTTLESRDVFALLRAGVEAGAGEVVMEVSSHALAQGRVAGLPFDAAVFTNFTQDHLDFHGTMENYFAAKRSLFDGTVGEPPRAAVINVEDPRGPELAIIAQSAGAQVYHYGLAAADFRVESVQMSTGGMSFGLITPRGSVDIGMRLTGRVNLYNFLAAAAAAQARGLSLEQIAAGASALPCVPGRFQTVDAGQPFTVVVDYAHTDDALRNLTALARAFVRHAGTDSGRVITLFGCGGDRDRAKRPRMGRAAGEGSDLVILTSDNPRSEDPQAILADILPGLESAGARFLVEPDRARAIRLAIEVARPGDIVLLAGKGHEKEQILCDRIVPFDDAETAAAVLRDLTPVRA